MSSFKYLGMMLFDGEMIDTLFELFAKMNYRSKLLFYGDMENTVNRTATASGFTLAGNFVRCRKLKNNTVVRSFHCKQ